MDLAIVTSSFSISVTDATTIVVIILIIGGGGKPAQTILIPPLTVRGGQQNKSTEDKSETFRSEEGDGSCSWHRKSCPFMFI